MVGLGDVGRTPPIFGLPGAVLARDVDTGGRVPLDGARRTRGALRGIATPTFVRGRLGVTRAAREPDLAAPPPALVRALLGGDTPLPRSVARRVPVNGVRRCKVGRALETGAVGRRGEAVDGVTRLGARRSGLGVTPERPGPTGARRGSTCRGAAFGVEAVERRTGAADPGALATSRSLNCVVWRGAGGAWRRRTNGDQPSPGARAASVYLGRSRGGRGKTTRAPA